MSDVSDITQRRSRLSPAKRALLEQRLQGKREEQASPRVIPRLADRTVLPLSFAQQRLWFAHQWDPATATYNRPTALRLEGELHVPSLERGLVEILRRHDVLRTTFPAADGQPVQQVSPMAELSLPTEDLTHLPQGERLAAAQGRMIDMLREPFALESGPLYRVCLFRLDSADHLFFFVTHHILFDGWSEILFVNELCALYDSFEAGEQGALPDLPIQYADFAHWQREEAQEEALKAQIAYWREKLGGVLAVLDLPTDRPRPPVQTYRGATQSLVLSRSLVDELVAQSRQEDVTIFMTLLAAFNVMLCRYTGQTDIIVGTPVAGRRQTETEKLIGPFVNTLALRTDLAGDPTFRELLQRVRQTSLGAYAHQDVPFDVLVTELNPARDLGRTPVFQVLFNLENLPGRASSAGEVRVTLADLDSSVALFDLSVELLRRNGEIHCAFVYNTDLCDAATIQRMVGHYLNLLQGVVANPEQRLSELPLLSEAERRQVVVEWNQTQSKYPRDASIPELFEAQVARAPDAVAVMFEDKAWTYQELNQKANQLARHLQKLGVGPEVMVGLCVERSLEMMAALLGILKAGGAYVPLDPDYPHERLDFMLQDTRASVVVTQAQLMHKLGDCGARLVCMDRDREDIARESVTNPPHGASGDSLSYVMYTSGTTRRPKGVAVTHRGVVRLVKGSGYVRFGGEVFLQLAPLAFDASTFEIWGPLLNGARLVVMGMEPPSLEELGRALKEGGVTTLWLTAGLFHLMVEERLRDLGQLHQLLAGGDVLSVSDVARVVKELPAVRMINGYGPTENTTFSTCYTVPWPVLGSTVPIGRPISNSTAYVLDALAMKYNRLQPVPIGVPGELYLGGDGLARGYWNRPELTVERFLPDPFSAQAGARIYKTGDLARFLPDGNIEYLGRMDHQVKIRGYRVEPGEIEAVLREHPMVRDCVVLAREDTSGDKRLAAYVVAREAQCLASSELRRFLGDKLPDYMVPSAMVRLEALPLMPNGKVDRRALPTLDQFRPELEEAFVAPRTPVEVGLAEIWAKVLKLKRVGIHDDFFELGGHSLLATQVISRVRDAFHVEIPLRSLFERPTVAGLAERIEVFRILAQPQQDHPGAGVVGRV